MLHHELDHHKLRIQLHAFVAHLSCESKVLTRENTNMDTILDAQLERMETALGTLLSSIITYNPSVSAADELLLADDELSKGLEQRSCLWRSL